MCAPKSRKQNKELHVGYIHVSSVCASRRVCLLNLFAAPAINTELNESIFFVVEDKFFTSSVLNLKTFVMLKWTMSNLMQTILATYRYHTMPFGFLDIFC